MVLGIEHERSLTRNHQSFFQLQGYDSRMRLMVLIIRESTKVVSRGRVFGFPSQHKHAFTSLRASLANRSERGESDLRLDRRSEL